jgi:hypothetical protein
VGMMVIYYVVWLLIVIKQTRNWDYSFIVSINLQKKMVATQKCFLTQFGFATTYQAFQEHPCENNSLRRQ